MLVIKNIHKIEAKYIPRTQVRVVNVGEGVTNAGNKVYRIVLYNEISAKQFLITIYREAKEVDDDLYFPTMYKIELDGTIEKWFALSRFDTTDSFLVKIGLDFKDKFFTI